MIELADHFLLPLRGQKFRKKEINDKHIESIVCFSFAAEKGGVLDTLVVYHRNSSNKLESASAQKLESALVKRDDQYPALAKKKSK